MDVLGLVLDGLVLLLLAATIFVAWRLSQSMNAFRKGRKELESLIADLSRNIDKAELAITGLKSASRDAGSDLQVLVREARALSDELQLMTEAGDNIASRLERLAERNRDIAERIEKTAATPPEMAAQVALKRVQEHKSVPTGMSFAIRDRDVEEGIETEPDDWLADAPHSKAERELMAALQKSGKAKTGGVS